MPKGWLFTELWAQLQFDDFWRPLLPDSREGTSWYHTLVTLAYRLIDPGSEWRLPFGSAQGLEPFGHELRAEWLVETASAGSPARRPPLFPSAASLVRAIGDG